MEICRDIFSSFDIFQHYMKDNDGLCTILTQPLRKDKHKEISTTVFIETFKKGITNFFSYSLVEVVVRGEFVKVGSITISA